MTQKYDTKIRHQHGAVTIRKELSLKILSYNPNLWIVILK